MPRDLVVFGEDWGRHPSSTQHLVKRLAEDRRVLWVNSIGLRRPRFSLRDAGRAVEKLRMAAGRRGGAPAGDRARPSDPVDVLSPFALPWPGSRIAEAINRGALARQIRPRLAGRASRPILWASLPTAAAVTGALGESAVVYYCGDDFGGLAGVDHAAVLRDEERLAARADLVIAASPALAARFPAEKTLLVEHGVDFDLFASPVPRAEDLPAGPVAGFYGALADWIDVPLLAETARRLPGWTFCFVGPVLTAIDELAELPNVRLLGPRPHADLPRYSAHWTASLLPFRDCAQIRACNPLKLREYLAAGTPVVSTPFPALAPYAGHVATVRGPDAFVAALEAARTDQGDRAARRARVADETWTARARVVADALERLG